MTKRELVHTGSDLARETLDLTRSLLTRHSRRMTGSAECLLAAREIADLMHEHCDRVAEEPFEVHPGSLWNVGRILATAYVLTALLLIAGGDFVYPAVVICLLGLVYGLTHYILYGTLFDKLFPAAQGRNVVGVLDPAGEVKQQILFVGHHDSPYVFTFLQRFQELAAIRMILAIIAYLLLTVISLMAIAMRLAGGDWSLRGAPLWIVGVGLAVVLPLFWLITSTPSPGAGDNLNATAMAIKLAEFFAARGQSGEPLQHSRLILLSADGEEVGQRGAAAYAKRHRNELLAVPTYVLNVDAVYRLDDLAVTTRDRNNTLALSARLAKECGRLAAELGYPIKEIALPTGGTDAGPFARAGLDATTFVGISTALFSRGRVYHTLDDTVEHIEPAAVEAVLDIAVNYVLRKEDEGRGWICAE